MSNISTEQFCQKLHVRRCVRNSAFLNWFKIPGLRFDDMGFRTRIRASQSCTYFLRYMITQWHQGQVIGSSAIKRHGSSGWCKSRSLRFVLAVSIEGGAFFWTYAWKLHEPCFRWINDPHFVHWLRTTWVYYFVSFDSSSLKFGNLNFDSVPRSLFAYEFVFQGEWVLKRKFLTIKELKILVTMS